MNVVAIAEFYLKHNADFSKLIPKGVGDPTLLRDAVNFIKRHFPQYNPNNILDDALALFENQTTPPANNSQI